MRKESSTNYLNQQELESFCDAAFTLSLISGRWKLTIITALADGERQFSSLKECIPAITERVLALQLKGLEQAGLIEKTAGYRLSTRGKSLLPLIDHLAVWGKLNKES